MSNEIQQGLQDDLTTIEPDLMNMTRLFSLPDSVWDAPEYHFAAAIEGGQYVIRFYGKTQAVQGVTDIPSDADARIQALHRRRALRRLCRQTLYDLLRKETGIHPPWGSMTGIRPTHLMYEALNEGMSMADAQEHLVHQFDVAPEKAALLAELVSVQQQLPPPGDAGWTCTSAFRSAQRAAPTAPFQRRTGRRAFGCTLPDGAVPGDGCLCAAPARRGEEAARGLRRGRNADIAE